MLFKTIVFLNLCYSSYFIYCYKKDNILKILVNNEIIYPYKQFVLRKYKKIKDGETNLYNNKDFFNTIITISKGVGKMIIFPISLRNYKDYIIKTKGIQSINKLNSNYINKVKDIQIAKDNYQYKDESNEYNKKLKIKNSLNKNIENLDRKDINRSAIYNYKCNLISAYNFINTKIDKQEINNYLKLEYTVSEYVLFRGREFSKKTLDNSKRIAIINKLVNKSKYNLDYNISWLKNVLLYKELGVYFIDDMLDIEDKTISYKKIKNIV